MAMSGFTFTVFPTSSTVIGFAPGVSREGGERRERGERRGRREEGREQGMIEGGVDGGIEKMNGERIEKERGRGGGMN